jgi:hypothetical protein
VFPGTAPGNGWRSFGGGELRSSWASSISCATSFEKICHEVRQKEGRRGVPKPGGRVPCLGRNQRNSVAVTADSDELFRQHGGDLNRDLRGEMERIGRAFK